MLGVEVDRRTDGARGVEDRTEPLQCLRDTFVGGRRREQRRDRARLHRDVDARKKSPGIIVECRVGRPCRRGAWRARRASRAHAVHTGRRRRWSASSHRGDRPSSRSRGPDRLAVPVTASAASAPPMNWCAIRWMPPRATALAARAPKGTASRGAEAGPHDAGRIVGTQVLVEVVEHVVGRRARGEDVDEPEQSGLEVWALRRPAQQTLIDIEGAADSGDRCRLRASKDRAGEILDVLLDRSRHVPVLPCLKRRGAHTPVSLQTAS